MTQAISRNGTPEKINIDKSGANAAAIVSYNAEHGTQIHKLMRMIRKDQWKAVGKSASVPPISSRLWLPNRLDEEG